MQQIRRAYMVLVFIAFSVSILFAQTEYDDERESLRGLTGVYVFVEEPSKDLIDAGITTKILETDVEVKLRVTGIRVLSRNQSETILIVAVSGIKISGGYAYVIKVHFHQSVYLSRQPSTKVFAVTWNQGIGGITSNVNRVREVLRDNVDAFINDFLAVNPK